MELTRRALTGLAVTAAAAGAARAAPSATAQSWRTVAAQYDKPAGVIQLENGNWGAMARPVLAAYEEATRRVNRDTSYYARRQFDADFSLVRERAAESLGVSPDELVFTRGATEALQTLIGGYNKLTSGDCVLYADTDYDAMQAAMRWLERRRGVRAIAIALPERPTRQALLDAYTEALEREPRIKLALLTHISHRNGLRLPVAAIAEGLRARGVEVIVDAAHSWGQLDFRVPDFKADFVGFNGHKFLGAPIGVGLIYCAKARIADIDPSMSEDPANPDIRARVHTGTANHAAFLAVPAALDFQQRIGAGAIEARLTGLRARWTDRLRGRGGVECLTPDNAELGSATGAFRLTGQTSADANIALAKTLLSRGIFTVHRTGLAAGACIRVTAALHTSESDIDRFSAVLDEILAKG